MLKAQIMELWGNLLTLLSESLCRWRWSCLRWQRPFCTSPPRELGGVAWGAFLHFSRNRMREGASSNPKSPVSAKIHQTKPTQRGRLRFPPGAGERGVWKGCCSSSSEALVNFELGLLLPAAAAAGGRGVHVSAPLHVSLRKAARHTGDRSVLLRCFTRFTTSLSNQTRACRYSLPGT